MSVVLESQRFFLTIFIWALLLEIIALTYYVSSGQTWRFEFGLTVFVTILTVLGIILVIGKIKKEL